MPALQSTKNGINEIIGAVLCIALTDCNKLNVVVIYYLHLWCLLVAGFRAFYAGRGHTAQGRHHNARRTPRLRGDVARRAGGVARGTPRRGEQGHLFKL